jgi:hypothetical protein
VNINDRVRVCSEGSTLLGKEGVITKLIPGGYDVMLDEDSHEGGLGSIWFASFEVEVIV